MWRYVPNGLNRYFAGSIVLMLPVYLLKMIQSPLLIVGYNRFEIAKQTLAWVKRSKPRKVYFAIDGPKTMADNKQVTKVRDLYLNGISGAECNYIINEYNKGPEKTISEAISTVLKEENRVVVLEDDVIAPNCFFYFVDEMLERYENDDRVAMITGSNFINQSKDAGGDYFFAYCGSTLSGWATWRRAWEMFDLKESFQIDRATLKRRFLLNRQINYYHRAFKVFSLLPSGSNTWDCCWQYERIKNGKLSIIPAINLTSNIGEHGTHFNGAAFCHKTAMSKDFVVHEHPQLIECDQSWDTRLYELYLSSSLLNSALTNIELISRIRKIRNEYNRQGY